VFWVRPVIRELPYGAQPSCAHILAEDPSAQDGVYFLTSAADGSISQARCDMHNGGWTLFGVNANHPTLAVPETFFRGTGGVHPFVESYAGKYTWSGDIFDFVPSGSALEMAINIQTSDFSNSASAATENPLYTNGVINVPDSELLTLNDDQLEQREPLNIWHTCGLPQSAADYHRSLYTVDRDASGNSHMQLTDGSLGETDAYSHDLWHWNSGPAYYFRCACRPVRYVPLRRCAWEHACLMAVPGAHR
jgi:hypothetical protein